VYHIGGLTQLFKYSPGIVLRPEYEVTNQELLDGWFNAVHFCLLRSGLKLTHTLSFSDLVQASREAVDLSTRPQSFLARKKVDCSMSTDEPTSGKRKAPDDVIVEEKKTDLPTEKKPRELPPASQLGGHAAAACAISNPATAIIP
jgi:hypothetical protein